MIDEDIHDDPGARRMLDILTDPEADAERRGQAAIKLGPGLQLCDERIGWDDLDLYLGKATFEKIDKTFRRFYHDASTPKLVRRRILEAAACAPMDWHEGAVRAAWATDDDDWRQLAIEALIWCGNDKSERVLEKLTRHPDSDIADTAEWALGELRMFRQIPDDPAGFDEDLF